jgi:hypothetical protein
MSGRAAGFRPAVTGGVGLLSPGSDWLTDCPDFGWTALRSPMYLKVRSTENLNNHRQIWRWGDKMVRAGFGGGNVDEKLREQIVSALEKAMKAVGAKDYESGMEQTSRLAAAVHESVESMKTLDDLRVLLDRLPPLSKREELIISMISRNLPGILRLGFKLAAKRAAADLPALANGRPPALSSQQAHEAIDYVSKLNRQGCSFEVAKSRTAQKFACSLRTIERLWKDRAAFLNDQGEPDVTIHEALRYISQGK